MKTLLQNTFPKYISGIGVQKNITSRLIYIKQDFNTK